MILAFCRHEKIGSFSVIGYSVGSHYATAVVEELPAMVGAYIIAAPSSINPGMLIQFFGKIKAGNKDLEKLMLSEKAMTRIISFFKWSRFIDATGRDILHKEVGTPELRVCLICFFFTYLRLLEADENKLIELLNLYKIKSIFIFGRYDKMYLPGIGKKFFSKFKPDEVIVLDESTR